jgi:hypothetical protein
VEQEIEAANDTQINAQISRGPDEFARFEEMDREREEKVSSIDLLPSFLLSSISSSLPVLIIQRRSQWTECGHLGFAPPRLMLEKELPDWLQVDIGSQV